VTADGGTSLGTEAGAQAQESGPGKDEGGAVEPVAAETQESLRKPEGKGDGKSKNKPKEDGRDVLKAELKAEVKAEILQEVKQEVKAEIRAEVLAEGKTAAATPSTPKTLAQLMKVDLRRRRRFRS
jgi:hypothetical protein